MAKSFLMIVILFSSLAKANIFDFVSSEGSESKIAAWTKRLTKLEIKDGPDFEENFNGIVKGIESAMEEEKLYCSGEAQNAQGKTLPQSQKQLCMRELKKQYIDSMNVIFEVKKKYLIQLHQRQLQKLKETHTRLQSDIEKNF
jgi:hypothetical protein